MISIIVFQNNSFKISIFNRFKIFIHAFASFFYIHVLKYITISKYIFVYALFSFYKFRLYNCFQVCYYFKIIFIYVAKVINHWFNVYYYYYCTKFQCIHFDGCAPRYGIKWSIFGSYFIQNIKHILLILDINIYDIFIWYKETYTYIEYSSKNLHNIVYLKVVVEIWVIYLFVNYRTFCKR